MAKRKDLTGQRYGMLTVVGFAPDEKRSDGSNRVMFKCVCDCGAEVNYQGRYLRSGDAKTCGKHKNTALRRKKHGMHGTRIYNIWQGMKQRCLNPNNKNYPDYGGRGISLCEDWIEFLPFYEWQISNGYDDALSIDRIDVNGDYCPENCRWATSYEQANNMRSNRYITVESGETKTLSEWSKITGISVATISNRLKRGLGPDDAVRVR